MSSSGLGESFVAAIQASFSVLLVIFYGCVAAYLGLLDSQSSKKVSKTCVRMFLPALLLTQIGSELHAGSAGKYGLIVVWGLLVHLVSFLIGIFGHLALGMPDWTTVAIMFNNSTSYPLLLVGALQETGVLSGLTNSGESSSAAVERAKSYFLVYATISSCLTFAVGPRLIDSEHAPEHHEEAKPDGNGHDDVESGETTQVDEQTGLLDENGGRSSSIKFSDPFARRGSFFPSTRQITTAPKQSAQDMKRKASIVTHKQWVRFSPRVKWWLLFVSDFFNAPLLGALLGAVIGLTPVLHKAFFADTQDGGIFTAWLTASLKTIGSVFVPLPVVIAGVSLYTSYKDAKRREREHEEASEGLPWWTVTFIMIVRFVLWPIASIGIVYLLAAKTELLGNDPMLWFTLMLMPTGPPAMKLITLVQVSDADDAEESIIAKLLTISYILSPILSLTVVGSLKVAEGALS